MGLPKQIANGQNSQPCSYKKQDGTECQGMGETLERWGEWAKECFLKEHNSRKPEIEHITYNEWGKAITRAPGNLREIREHSELTQIMR